MGRLQTCLMPLVRRSGQRCFASASLRSRVRVIPTSACMRQSRCRRADRARARYAGARRGRGEGHPMTTLGSRQTPLRSAVTGTFTSLVLVTNTRDFVLVGEGCERAVRSKLETFRLAENAEAFDRRLQKTTCLRSAKSARDSANICSRALSHRAVAHRAEGPGVAARVLCP